MFLYVERERERERWEGGCLYVSKIKEITRYLRPDDGTFRYFGTPDIHLRARLTFDERNMRESEVVWCDKDALSGVHLSRSPCLLPEISRQESTSLARNFSFLLHSDYHIAFNSRLINLTIV